MNMGLFHFFKRKKEPLTSEQKWDLMWDLWMQGKAASPYGELMHYESEVNNGGHSQYFFNLSNSDEYDLSAEVETILPILPEPLRENLKRGYDAFAVQEDISSDENDELFDECDDVFYENEQLLISVLKEYAESLT